MTGAHTNLIVCPVCRRKKGTGATKSVGFDRPNDFLECTLCIKRCNACKSEWIGDTVIYVGGTRITYRTNDAAKRAVAAAVRRQAVDEEASAARLLGEAIRYRKLADRIEGVSSPKDTIEEADALLLTLVADLSELNTSAEGRSSLWRVLPSTLWGVVAAAKAWKKASEPKPKPTKPTKPKATTAATAATASTASKHKASKSKRTTAKRKVT